MADGTTESNPATAVSEPATGGQAGAVDTGTQAGQNGSASGQGQSASVEEQFSNVDPKTLPPEMQGIYKNLQADYTKKTQSVAELRKKAEYYDQLAANQRVVEFVRGLDKPQAQAKQQQSEAAAAKKLAEVITPEEFQQAFTSQDKFLELLERAVKHTSEGSQKEISALKAQLSVKDAGDVVESFATQMKDGQMVRPDFYALDEDGLITGYLTVNQPEEASEKSYMSKLNEAYSWAKQTTQKYYEKGRQDALARIQQKAATSTEMPTTAAKTKISASDAKKWSVSEAIERAKRGERVSQVYD